MHISPLCAEIWSGFSLHRFWVHYQNLLSSHVQLFCCVQKTMFSCSCPLLVLTPYQWSMSLRGGGCVICMYRDIISHIYSIYIFISLIGKLQANERHCLKWFCWCSITCMCKCVLFKNINLILLNMRLLGILEIQFLILNFMH